MNDDAAANFAHIRDLARVMNRLVPSDTGESRRFRNELAGMFSVSIVATYETIIKEALIEHAGSQHPNYRNYIEQDFQKSNARISLDDLKGYSRKFGLTPWTGPDAPKRATTFHRMLRDRRQVIERRFRRDLATSYNSLFQWRNDYAHERTANATLSEVYDAHRVAQYVVRIFLDALKAG